MLGGTALYGRDAGPTKRCVILVDPHGDLATAALGLVPPERHEDVVYLDLANRGRPFGVNLLDVGLGWGPVAGGGQRAACIQARVRRVLGTAHGGCIPFRAHGAVRGERSNVPCGPDRRTELATHRARGSGPAGDPEFPQ